MVPSAGLHCREARYSIGIVAVEHAIIAHSTANRGLDVPGRGPGLQALVLTISATDFAKPFSTSSTVVDPP
jgi:hypothetical protein